MPGSAWPRPARCSRSGLGDVNRPAPAAVLDRHHPRLLRAQALDVGLRRLQAAEPEWRHGPVRPDAPDRPPSGAAPAVAGIGLAQLDLVVRRGLRAVLHSETTSTSTRSPSSVTC